MFSQTVPLWSLLIAIVIAVVLAGILIKKTIFPFSDQGHRCFAAKNEKAATVIATILSDLCGLNEKFTFDVGPTHQTLMDDGKTVIITHDKPKDGIQFPPDGLTGLTNNPRATAQKAAEMLKANGFTAMIVDNHMPDVEDNKFIFIVTDALLVSILGFRRHLMAMGEAPPQRKLLK
jgi:hypothetical protein